MAISNLANVESLAESRLLQLATTRQHLPEPRYRQQRPLQRCPFIDDEAEADDDDGDDEDEYGGVDDDTSHVSHMCNNTNNIVAINRRWIIDDTDDEATNGDTSGETIQNCDLAVPTANKHKRRRICLHDEEV